MGIRRPDGGECAVLETSGQPRDGVNLSTLMVSEAIEIVCNLMKLPGS